MDCDPQGSLSFWWQQRKRDTPHLARVNARNLGRILDAACARGIAHAIVDGPAHDLPTISAVMKQCDLLLIPTRPSILDLAALRKTIDMAQEEQRPYVVVNAALRRRNGLEAAVVAEARKAIDRLAAPVWSDSIVNRASFAHAMCTGRGITEYKPGWANRDRGWPSPRRPWASRGCALPRCASARCAG